MEHRRQSGTEPEIRRAVLADAERLTLLHLDCWDDAYTGLMPQHVLDARRADLPAAFERRRDLLASGAEVLLAESGDRLVGFVNAGLRDDELPGPALHLWALYVRRSHWATGLGHRLLEAAIGDHDCSLWVLEGNTRAIGFYERHGFVLDGTTEVAEEGRHLRMVRSTP